MEVITVLFSDLSEEEKKRLLKVNVDMVNSFTYSFENNTYESSMRKITGEMTPFKDTDIKLLEEKR